jgi:hypothetical protein
MRSRCLVGAAALAVVGGAVACGSGDAALESGDRAGFGPEAAADGGAAGAIPGEPPPEKEVESDYEAPVATGNFVWIANPKSGRVAFIDATTLQVRTVEAGNGPTYLGSVPGQSTDATVVLNVLSKDATVLRASGGKIEAKTIPTAAQANSLAFSDDGRFAIAWADARKVPNAPKTEGFQDLTVLDLSTNTSTILAVGYRPVAVGFAAGQPRAHAVTQDGVSILDLSGPPKLVKNVAISDTPNEDPGTRDVFVTKDGAYAFIRRDGDANVTAVALDTELRTPITLPGPVTDLDLADTGDRAVAVVRDTAQAVILPIPGIVSAPASGTTVTVTGETVGSVSIAPGGARGILYTNAVVAERVTVLDLQAATFRTVRLYSPVLGVFSSPDAQHAVVLHDKTDGPSGTPGAFSLVPVGQSLPAKIVATKAPPVAVAVTNDRAVVAERNNKTGTGIYGAYLARLPSLMVDRYDLASPPIAVGVVAGAKRAFIAQEHPEGRLTFVDLETGIARTLTGFELASRVVDGSKP